jgi:hypothetical protein
VVVVRVRQQHDVHVTEARIGLVDQEARVVQNAKARRIFEEKRAIPRAELALMTAKWSHLDHCCLPACGGGQKDETTCEKRHE